MQEKEMDDGESLASGAPPRLRRERPSLLNDSTPPMP